jgi:hypothetical protein
MTAAQPNYQDAYYQFKLAYQESAKSWKVLGNLGLCALKLERDQDALAYYEQYLEKGRSEIAAEERTAIEQDLLLLKGNLATVRITSPIADLKVVDQRAGSAAPAQPYALEGGTLELRLRAGNHSITATNGDKRLTWDIVLEPQTVASHVFDFEQPAAAPAATPAPASAAVTPAAPNASPADADRPAQGTSGVRIGAYVALGIGAASLGLGGYFLWQSSDYSGQADDKYAACHLRICLPAEQAEIRTLESDSSSAKTRAAVTLGIGGAAVVTGIVMLVLAPSSSEHESRRAQLAPWIGYRAAGVSGTF